GGLVDQRGGAPALREDLDPALLVPARERDPDPAPRELVEQRDALGQPDGVGGRGDQRHRVEVDGGGAGGQVGVEQQRVRHHLAALGVQVGLGGGERVVAQL